MRPWIFLHPSNGHNWACGALGPGLNAKAVYRFLTDQSGLSIGDKRCLQDLDPFRLASVCLWLWFIFSCMYYCSRLSFGYKFISIFSTAVSSFTTAVSSPNTQELLALCGGRMSLRSEPLCGNRFWVWFWELVGTNVVVGAENTTNIFPFWVWMLGSAFGGCDLGASCLQFLNSWNTRLRMSAKSRSRVPASVSRVMVYAEAGRDVFLNF